MDKKQDMSKGDGVFGNSSAQIQQRLIEQLLRVAAEALAISDDRIVRCRRCGYPAGECPEWCLTSLCYRASEALKPSSSSTQPIGESRAFAESYQLALETLPLPDPEPYHHEPSCAKFSAASRPAQTCATCKHYKQDAHRMSGPCELGVKFDLGSCVPYNFGCTLHEPAPPGPVAQEKDK